MTVVSKADILQCLPLLEAHWGRMDRMAWMDVLMQAQHVEGLTPEGAHTYGEMIGHLMALPNRVHEERN